MEEKTVGQEDLNQIKEECERIFWEDTDMHMKMYMSEVLAEDWRKKVRGRNMRTINRRLLGRLWYWPYKKKGYQFKLINTEAILVTRRVHAHVIRTFLEENGM